MAKSAQIVENKGSAFLQRDQIASRRAEETNDAG
jgi:hypothetical protein